MAAPAFDLSPALDDPARRRALYAVGAELWPDLVLAAWADGQDGPEDGNWRALFEEARGWERPEFPLTGRDVKKLGVKEGAEVGKLLRAVEAWWIEGDFRAGREECLAWLTRRAG